MTLREYRRKGFAKAVVSAALKYLKARKLIPRYQFHYRNSASHRLAQSFIVARLERLRDPSRTSFSNIPRRCDGIVLIYYGSQVQLALLIHPVFTSHRSGMLTDVPPYWATVSTVLYVVPPSSRRVVRSHYYNMTKRKNSRGGRARSTTSESVPKPRQRMRGKTNATQIHDTMVGIYVLQNRQFPGLIVLCRV